LRAGLSTIDRDPSLVLVTASCRVQHTCLALGVGEANS
jgi:hypothetical protein